MVCVHGDIIRAWLIFIAIDLVIKYSVNIANELIVSIGHFAMATVDSDRSVWTNTLTGLDIGDREWHQHKWGSASIEPYCPHLGQTRQPSDPTASRTNTKMENGCNAIRIEPATHNQSRRRTEIHKENKIKNNFNQEHFKRNECLGLMPMPNIIFKIFFFVSFLTTIARLKL